ncbi:hypothetical protein ALC56_04012, partial [Trachymyrmex septentrionalis]
YPLLDYSSYDRAGVEVYIGLPYKAFGRFFLHISRYQFCDSEMGLEKRLTRGDQDINPLDSACREHVNVFASHCHSSYKDRNEGMNFKTNKKKEEQADTSYGETWRRPSCSTVAERSQVVSRQSGGSRQDCKQ